jgi:hypothetical protein
MKQLQINWIEHYMKVQVRIAYALPACCEVLAGSKPGSVWVDRRSQWQAQSESVTTGRASRHACVGRPRSNQNEWATQWGIKWARRW